MQIAGGIYHVISRGTGPCIIFPEKRDCQSFLLTFGSVLDRQGWVCIAYVLMGTHYHLIVLIRDADLAQGMQRLNGLYAQAFNRRHGRVGSLFQGRYHAVLIETEEQLLETARYVALNPVRAGLCSRPEDWPWSSYAVILGRAPKPPFDVGAPLLRLLGAGDVDSLRELVEAGLSPFQTPLHSRHRV